MESPSVCVDAILNAVELASSFFLDPYSLSMSSLSEALCMIINVLVLCSTCLIISLVRLEKSPEYLSRETTQVLFF